jgi:predicted flavoprotein YhiN
MNYEKWRDFLTQSAHDQPNKQLDTILWFHFPNRFVDAILTQNNMNKAIKIWHLSKEDKKILAHLLWDGIDLIITARRAWDEFVTAGGVPACEIDYKTMESLICPWLYFAGEIIDVDGVTWGYNLTASWATGKLAGEGIIKENSFKS